MVKAFIAVVLGLAIVMSLPGLPPTAEASNICREVMEQQVCIETIKRSAKYSWEYRVVVSVDGKSHSLSRYDCRQPPQSCDQETTTALSETALSKATVQQFVCGLVSR